MRTQQALGIAALLAAGLVFGLAGGTAGSVRSVDWGYTASGGLLPPVDWGQAADICRTGVRQSPIALGSLDALPGAGIAAPGIHYGTSDLVITNSGHGIQANVERGAGEIDIDGTTFRLLQFHIHRASEHMVDGELTPAEMHLVHSDADGNLAVLGLMLVEGNHSTRLNPFFRAAERLAAEGDKRHVAGFDLKRLLPGASGFYHYTGSLTTPQCSEGVSWWVWKAHTAVSADQLATLLVGIPDDRFPQGNRRPPQARNGRAVYSVPE